MKNCAVIPASGAGSRTGLDIPKQFYKIHNKTVLEYSIEAFENHFGIDEIIIAANPDFIKETEAAAFKYSKVKAVIKGGETRQISVHNALKALSDKAFDNVLIHDAARPFVNTEIIDRCLNALKEHEALCTAVSCSDTIIQVNNSEIITSVPDRRLLRRCQTPQCFRYRLIKTAHELAEKDNYISASDDCGLILKYTSCPVYVIEGSADNIKITYPSDIAYAERLI